MKFRVTVADTFFFVLDDLASAQSDAMDHARFLTKETGQPVRVMVHGLGPTVTDNLGRDMTEVLWIGSAVGRINHRQAFVSWMPAAVTSPAVFKHQRVAS